MSRRAGAIASLAILSSFSLPFSSSSSPRAFSPRCLTAASTTSRQFSIAQLLRSSQLSTCLKPYQLFTLTPSLLSHSLLLTAPSSLSREVYAWNCGLGPSRVKPTPGTTTRDQPNRAWVSASCHRWEVDISNTLLFPFPPIATSEASQPAI